MATPRARVLMMWTAYERALAANPLRTKMLTSFFLMGLGDTVAQRADTASSGRQWSWDVRRTGGMMLLGLCGHAPYFHTWYRFLDGRFTGRATATVLQKVALDVTVAGPLYLCIVLCYTALLRTGDASRCVANVRDNFASLYAGGVTWHAVAQSINFRFVPNRQRILYDNMVSVGWKTILSFAANRRLNAQSDEESASSVIKVEVSAA